MHLIPSPHRSSSSSTTTCPASTTKTRAVWKSGPSPRKCLLLALCCYCLLTSSTSSFSMLNGVSALTISVATRNGVYHHIERRQIPEPIGEGGGDDGGGGAPGRLPHTPYTPGNGGEFQPGSSRKKKRSSWLSDNGGGLSSVLHIRLAGRAPPVAVSVNQFEHRRDKAGQGIIFGEGEVTTGVPAVAPAAAATRMSALGLKDQTTDPLAQVEFVNSIPNVGEQHDEGEENDDHHRHELKEGVAAAAERFEHMDVWSEDDEDEASTGFIQPIHFPAPDLFEKNIHIAPKHVAHSEHDYLDESEDDDRCDDGEDEQQDGQPTTMMNWSVDEWEEEFEGDLADWADWIDDHEELQRRESEVFSLKVKVKVMGHDSLEHAPQHDKKEEENPFQRLFSESWF